MNAVYALYRDGNAAQQAVNGLRASGLSLDQITIITPYPMEDFEFFQADRRTRMWYIACLGALIGFSLGTWLTRTGQLLWPVVTGGMPITPWWPNMVIIFECTMLGSILATVISLLVSASLPARSKRLLYDTEVTNGQILVGVEDPVERTVEDLTRILAAPAGAIVKRV
ncbi:MAG: DUF3341 domain-containing protein [Acidobacteria bacterium]|nr:DUF3341 domain-containing protein [Acidobacteriota bacterium]